MEFRENFNQRSRAENIDYLVENVRWEEFVKYIKCYRGKRLYSISSLEDDEIIDSCYYFSNKKEKEYRNDQRGILD
jgi:hypothetical protein